ncbi:MAG: hypothetical protein IRZ32_16300, partial [Solirubrobacteraceae bacterium]|nr:hypothetical protein [Solirubrobacteraceae bacterium]
MAADTLITTPEPPARTRRRPADRHGYVTDGERLYRVVSPVDVELGIDDAVLEDCATLQWRVYSHVELWWLRLREV